MGKSTLLVKRHGHIEEYDARKTYASIYAAALAAHLTEQDAERIAAKTQAVVEKEIKRRHEITSEDIRKVIIEELGGEENDIAYLYMHHLNLS